MNGPGISLLAAVAAILSVAGSGNAWSADSARRSIKEWTSCSGAKDDADNVARAFDAAKHGAFTLVVDCPVRIHIGIDVARTIFIDDGTTVEFTGAGKFTVDNVMHPAFAIANSKDITMTNWNLEYDASLPVDMKQPGYEDGGKFVARPGNTPAAGAFNDVTLTHWLSVNRGIQFDKAQGNVGSMWMGPSNSSAIFFISGDSSNIKVTGMRLYAPPSAGPDRFIPMAFSLKQNYKSNQHVTATTPKTAQYVGLPHDMTFTDIDIDGYYFGWQGNSQNVSYEKIRAHRYADLVDANGQNTGGVGKWFAPPHLFYLNFDPLGDPGLFNKNLHLHDVIDSGTRVGQARDKGGSDSRSGYDMSLKIGGVDNTVDQYVSKRPDGFLDLLSSDGLTISNVDATYDSSFINNLFPGWRFPQTPYHRVTFKNIVFKDLAATSTQPPIDNPGLGVVDGMVFSNVRIEMNHWAGKKPLPLPSFSGDTHDLEMEFIIAGDGMRVTSSVKGPVSVVLVAKTSPDGSTSLSWTSQQAQSCSAGGEWSGSQPASGERTVQTSAASEHDFTLSCRGATATASTKMRVSSAR